MPVTPFSKVTQAAMDALAELANSKSIGGRPFSFSGTSGWKTELERMAGQAAIATSIQTGAFNYRTLNQYIGNIQVPLGAFYDRKSVSTSINNGGYTYQNYCGSCVFYSKTPPSFAELWSGTVTLSKVADLLPIPSTSCLGGDAPYSTLLPNITPYNGGVVQIRCGWTSVCHLYGATLLDFYMTHAKTDNIPSVASASVGIVSSKSSYMLKSWKIIETTETALLGIDDAQFVAGGQIPHLHIRRRPVLRNGIYIPNPNTTNAVNITIGYKTLAGVFVPMRILKIESGNLETVATVNIACINNQPLYYQTTEPISISGPFRLTGVNNEMPDFYQIKQNGGIDSIGLPIMADHYNQLQTLLNKL
jgi:hypothetical protein